MWTVWRSIAAFLVVALPGAASADVAKSHRGQDRSSAYMRIFAPTLPPYGFVRFCDSQAQECAQSTFSEARFDMTGARARELDEINRHINKTIEPATDMELYGEVERWTLPTTKGDCEDYALLKRKVLIERGWPASSMLMTVVRDEKGEGHAVLTARTSQGDFILDNKTDEIRIWHKSPYTFVMRQSYIDPRVWVSLDPKDATSPALLSGVRPAR